MVTNLLNYKTWPHKIINLKITELKLKIKSYKLKSIEVKQLREGFPFFILKSPAPRSILFFNFLPHGGLRLLKQLRYTEC